MQDAYFKERNKRVTYSYSIQAVDGIFLLVKFMPSFLSSFKRKEEEGILFHSILNIFPVDI